jgi:hypothetical protein
VTELTFGPYLNLRTHARRVLARCRPATMSLYTLARTTDSDVVPALRVDKAGLRCTERRDFRNWLARRALIIHCAWSLPNCPSGWNATRLVECIRRSEGVPYLTPIFLRVATAQANQAWWLATLSNHALRSARRPLVATARKDEGARPGWGG